MALPSFNSMAKVVVALASLSYFGTVGSAPSSFSLASTPLFMASNNAPNVLLAFDTSFSMLYDVTDTTYKGPTDTNSKAQIAFTAANWFSFSNQGKINLGLMTYKYQGANLVITSGGYDNDATLASGASTETTKVPFRLTAYPSGTGIAAAPYDDPAHPEKGKSSYAFAPGELIHYRYVIVNKGPEKAVNPRLKLMLPQSMVLSGYDSGTQQYSGVQSVFSQHPSQQWTCHSPSALAGKTTSSSSPPSQTPAFDARIYCDAPEMNNNETSFVEFYAYWSGYGGGTHLNPFLYVADSQCDTQTDCQTVTGLARDPVTSSSGSYTGFGNDSGNFATPPLANGVGLHRIYPVTSLGTPSTIKHYVWITNNSGSNFSGPLTMTFKIDNPQGIGTYPSNASGYRFTPTNTRQVTYSSACGNRQSAACYSTAASSSWSCVNSNMITGDSNSSPDGYRGITCTRSSNMPATTLTNIDGTAEILELTAETNSGYNLTISDVGAAFQFSSTLTSSSDPSHVIDPAYSGGAGYASLSPKPTIGTCNTTVSVGTSTVKKGDSFAAASVTTSFGGAGAYCFSSVGGENKDLGVQSNASYSTYGTPGGASLIRPIAPLTPSNMAFLTDMNTGIFQCNLGSDVSNAATLSPKCNNNGLKFFYETPISGTLAAADRYFSQTLTASDNATGLSLTDLNTVGGVYPQFPQDSCHRKYLILLTDGNNTIDPSGNKYPDLNTATLEAITQAQNLYNHGVTVFVIAFGSGASKASADAIAQAGSGGSCISTTCTGGTVAYAANNLSSLVSAFDSITASISTRSSFSAMALSAPIEWNIFFPVTYNLLYQTQFVTGSWHGSLNAYTVSTDKKSLSPTWSSDSFFDMQPWQVTDADANAAYGPLLLTMRRNIFSAKRPSLLDGDAPGVSKGISFAWPSNPSTPSSSEMNVWQSTLLNQDEGGSLDGHGSLRLNWLRGDRSNEVSLFRERIHLLGDIVDSTPLSLSAPSDPRITEASYATFKASHKSREPMIYTGANDGFFHAFYARAGAEAFAFAPSFIYPRLSQLTRKDYSTHHIYTVNGSPMSTDALFSDGQWHSLVVSGVNAGGRGYFALDVTNPTPLSTSWWSYTPQNTTGIWHEDDPSGTHATQLLAWEFTSTNSHSGTINGSGVPTGIVTGDSDLGFTYSQPVGGRIKIGTSTSYVLKSVLIFGNGYNNTDTTMGSASSTGLAALYIVDAETGYLIRKIPVPVGTPSVPNGLGSPLAIDSDHDGTIDRVYAGDLYGNLWRFNLYDGTSYLASDFKIAFGGSPLYQATDGHGNSRPITGQLKAAHHPLTGYMILFGSGQYLSTTDVKSSYVSSDEDALYSVWDRDETTFINPASPDPRDQLNGMQTKTCEHVALVGDTSASTNSCAGTLDPYHSAGTYIQTEPVAATKPYCGRNDTPSSSCVMGCYLSLKNIPVSGWNGERFIYSPQVTGKVAQFNSIIPPQNLCSFTDQGLTMEYMFDFMSCQPLSYSPYDINHDGSFNASDLLTSVSGGSMTPSGQIVTGLTPGGVHNTSYNGPTYIYDNSSANTSIPTVNYINLPSSGGRISWRELQPHQINPKP